MVHTYLLSGADIQPLEYIRGKVIRTLYNCWGRHLVPIFRSLPAVFSHVRAQLSRGSFVSALNSCDVVVILAGLIILPRYESPAVGSANLLTGEQLGIFGEGGWSGSITLLV